MSTYTDLHNRVKENITVDYNNRITAQRVRLFNEQNEFWGTLRGHISAENINIEGGSLSGVTLTDTVLKGSVALPDGIDLHKVLQQISQISSDLIDTTENLDQEIADRKTAIEDEKDTRVSAISYESYQRSLKDTELCGEIKQTNKDLVREISTLNIVLTKQASDISTTLSTELSSKIYNEQEARIANDNYLSNVLSSSVDCLSDAIVDSRSDFGREVYDRTVADNKLELSIANETSDSKLRDDSISSSLSTHMLDNIESFKNLSSNILSVIEHERHYVINNGDGTSMLTDDWPYSSKDFAVNIYNPTLNDGAVYYKDAADVRYEIGQLYKNTTASLYPFTFKTLKDIQHEGIASALIGNWSYGFDTDKKSQHTLLNGYTITFDDTKTTHVLSDYTFALTPTLPQFHKIKYDTSMIGKVVEAYLSDYNENITSGIIWIDTNDSELEAFNAFRNVRFNKTDLSVCNKNTERITYLGENKLKFEKNIDTANFIGLYDQLSSEHYQFGRIYDSYNNISGIISDDTGISEINVRLSDPYNKFLNLKRENSFKNIIEEDVQLGDIYYNTILSANVDGLSGTFDEVKVSELYKYNFTAITKEGESIVGGYIVPKKYNKTIVESLDFTTVDANISNVMWITAFKKTYTLTKSTEASLWTVEDTDEDGNALNIKFNGLTLYIKVTSDSGTTVYQEHPVKINEPSIFNTDVCHTHVYTTNLVDLSKYGEIYESPEATYEITIESNVTTEAFTRYELNIDTSFTGELKIKIPNRSTLDISREFMVVINPDCSTNTLVKLTFLNEDGTEARIICNRRSMLLIPTNKWTTLQVKEINHNTFYVMDLDGNESDHEIEFLSNAISVETVNRISNDEFLSSIIELSTEKLQDQIISNDNDIKYLSNEVGFILSVDKETMNYKGTLPYLPHLSDDDGHDLGYNYLSTFILQNSTVSATNRLKVGDFFRLSAVQDRLLDAAKNSIWLGAKDYFVFNKDVSVSDVIDKDIDIFRNAETEFGWLSAALCSEIENLSTSLSNTTKLSVENLQGQIDFTKRDYTFISSEIIRLSTEISDNIDNLSVQLTAQLNQTSVFLSNDILSNDQEYSGNNQFDGQTTFNQHVFADTYVTITDTLQVKNGISVNSSVSIDKPDVPGILGGSKILLTNNVIKKIDDNVTCTYEYPEKSGTFAITQDVIDLSTALSTDIDSLSAKLSNTINLSVEELQNQVISNDNDIEFLSNDLSTLEYGHYNKTLSNDISVDHTYEDAKHHTIKITKVVDQLIILDEVTFDRYRLTVRNGSLNINKIDNVVPTI